MGARRHVAVKAAGQRIRRGEGFIYAAELVGCDAIKIGFSLHPELRAQTVARKVGVPMRMVSVVAGSLSQERQLHIALRKESHAPEAFGGVEFYPRSIFRHRALPQGLAPARGKAA